MSGASFKKTRARPQPVRVMVVDDHALVRRTLRQFLENEKGFEVVGEAANREETHPAVRRTRPDIVLLDLALGEDSGFQVLGDLNAERPAVPVLILSMHSEALYAPQCIAAGARGFLMKADAPDHLVEAIQRVLGGDTYLSPSMERHSAQPGSQSRPVVH